MFLTLFVLNNLWVNEEIRPAIHKLILSQKKSGRCSGLVTLQCRIILALEKHAEVFLQGVVFEYFGNHKIGNSI